MINRLILLKVSIASLLIVMLNFVFSNHVFITFDLGNMSNDKFSSIVSSLDEPYLRSVNEGYLVDQQDAHFITLIGWDSFKLIGEGFPIIHFALTPPWRG
jgi:hypothetical protein